MTKQEFIYCSILFVMKFKNRNIEDIVPATTNWRPVKGKIENCIVNVDNIMRVYLNGEKEACLFLDVKYNISIDGYGKRLHNYETFKTQKDFIKHFKLYLEDIV